MSEAQLAAIMAGLVAEHDRPTSETRGQTMLCPAWPPCPRHEIDARCDCGKGKIAHLWTLRFQDGATVELTRRVDQDHWSQRALDPWGRDLDR